MSSPRGESLIVPDGAKKYLRTVVAAGALMLGGAAAVAEAKPKQITNSSRDQQE